MTQQNLSQFYGLLPFLSSILGDTAEVLLEIPQQGVVAVENGKLMGHQVGDPLTPQTAMMLEKGRDRKQDSFSCAGHHPKSGKPIRRWHYFIKEEDTLVAILSVYSDMSDYVAVIDSLTRMVGESLPKYSDLPVDTSEKHGAVSSALIEMGLPHVEPHRLNENEKQQLVELLERHGVFEKKGAVGEIALQLGVSDATIYRYLTAVNRLRKRKLASSPSDNEIP